MTSSGSLWIIPTADDVDSPADPDVSTSFSGATRGTQRIPSFVAILGSSPGMTRSERLYVSLSGGWSYISRHGGCA
jgi:hypothetical protein